MQVQKCVRVVLYDIIITRIISRYGMGLSIDIGWSHFFHKCFLNKLNVFQVNDVWKHSMVNEDDKEDDQESSILDDHIQDTTLQLLVLSISHDFQILSQILSII